MSAVPVELSLVVPDPRRSPVPTGWAVSVAAPAILEADDWTWLDEAEARLRAMASYVESFAGDRLEFEKALRIVEKRRGDLLGSVRQGERTDLNTHVQVGEESHATRGRWRTLSENWDDLWPVVVEAARVSEVTQSQLLRVATGRSMDVHYSSESPEWSTPQDLFDELHAEFDFDLDVCATSENAKCERYFTTAEDGLARKWTGTCWMNPPYGSGIGQWIDKAWRSAQEGVTVVCLVPGRIETGWWWNYCRFGEVRVLRGRLKFGGGDTSAPFPSVVVVFGPDREASTRYWERP